MKKFKIKIVTRAALIRIAVLVAILAAAITFCYFSMLSMPGKSYSGEFEPLTQKEMNLRADLKAAVNKLSKEIGPRNILYYRKLDEAKTYIEHELSACGYEMSRVSYKINNLDFDNIQAQRKGTTDPNSIIVIGAHYDTAEGTPGANDNGSGVAVMLAMAKAAKSMVPGVTVRFVAFANEEPPFFQTEAMGSVVYAKHCRKNKDNIKAMISLETMGCYFDEPGTQHYPFPFSAFYPSKGNFIGFLGNYGSRQLVREIVSSFREKNNFPSEGAALPSRIVGVSWSDHWSFWQEGYPAIMVTDTAPFRYAQYHKPSDTPEKIEYDRLARVTANLGEILHRMARMEPNESNEPNSPVGVEASNRIASAK